MVSGENTGAPMLNIDSVGNLTFNVSALIISITCIFYTMMMQQKKNAQNKMYLLMIVIVMIDALADIGCEVVIHAVWPVAVRLSLYNLFRSVYFLTHFAIAPLFALYVLLFCGVSFRFSGKARLYLSLPFWLMEALVVVNPIFNCVYYIDRNMLFHRAWGVYAAYFISGFYTLFSIIALVMYWNILIKTKQYAITYFFAIVVVGTIIQMIFIEIRCEIMCEAIGLTGLMIIFENDDEWKDLSTGTLNRVAFLRDTKIYFKYPYDS